MKKIVALFLVLITLFSFAACGEKSKSGKNNNVKTRKEITFSETVYIDNDECRFAITSIKEDYGYGYYDYYSLELNAYLENKSSEKTYKFDLNSASVNGIQIGAYLYSDVAPGKKANETINIGNRILEKNGIEYFTDVTLEIEVSDADGGYSSKPLTTETIHIYPYGIKEAVKYKREAKDTDNVIIDKEGVKVTVIKCYTDEDGDYNVDLFLENNTGKTLVFRTDNEAINDYMIDSYFSETVNGGNCAFDKITWYNSDLKSNDIKQVDSVSFLFRVYESVDYWSNEDIIRENIELKP